MRSVDRRYTIEFVPAILAYVLIMLFAWPRILTIASLELRAPAARLQPQQKLPVLPVLPVLFVVRAIVRRITGGDELERRISLESMAIATTVVGVVSFAAAFLVIAKVINPGADVLIWVLPGLLAVYGCARMALTARYLRP